MTTFQIDCVAGCGPVEVTVGEWVRCRSCGTQYAEGIVMSSPLVGSTDPVVRIGMAAELVGSPPVESEPEAQVQ